MSVSPSVAATAGGTVVRISGSGLSKPVTVTVDGVEAVQPYVLQGTSQLVIVLPAHAPGAATITVTNSLGESASRADLVTFVVFPAIGAATPLQRISLTSAGDQAVASGSNHNGSVGGSLSGDGVLALFVSDADLGEGLTGTNLALYTRALDTGALTRVTPFGCDCSGALSLDGSRIVYKNFAGGPSLNYLQAPFTGPVVRVDAPISGVSPNGALGGFALAGEGRFVAFTSGATNLDAAVGDAPNTSDLFVRDLDLNITERWTLGRNIGAVSISADGDRLVFSTAQALLPEDTNAFTDLYLLDRGAGGVLRLLTVGANASTGSASVSADGRTVVFVSGASNLVASDTNGLSDVFVADYATGTIERLSLGAGGTNANASIISATTNANARFIVFSTAASNIVDGDLPNTSDLFVRDRATGATYAIAAAADGTLADTSLSGTISADGRSILLSGGASNLVSGDTNGLNDVFVKALPANTPTGTSVTVNPVDPHHAFAPVTVTLSNVMTAGDTTFVIQPPSPALPGHFVLQGIAAFDLSTTAVFTGPITVCADYDGLDTMSPADLRMVHFDGVWTDVTVSNDVGAHRICGVTTSLSPFALVINTDTTAPAIDMHENLAVETANPVGAPVTYALPTAVDDVDGAVPVTCTPASGSTFPVGTNVVSCGASDAAGNSASSSFLITVTLVAPPPPPTGTPLSSFVVLGRFQAWIRANSTVVSGNVGATSSTGSSPAADDEDAAEHDRAVEVRIAQGVTLQGPDSYVVGDTVVIRKQAVVHNVEFNELIGKKGTILGTKTTPVPPEFVALPAAPTVDPGTAAVTVSKNQTLTLAPGRYGTVHVGTKATLILTGGLYQVLSLDVDQGATVLFKAAVDLRIRRELDTDAKSKLILDTTVTGLTAAQVRITVLGADADCRHAGLADDDDEAGPTVVHIGPDAVVTANIFAPHGTLWIRARSTVTGALLADAVRIGAKVTLSLASGW